MPAFAAVPSSTHAVDSSDAILLNSGLFGAHARSSSFSTHLSGRFYKNSTLAAHAARKRRAARMRAKKRELEQAILLEERRAELLEERLRERKEECLRIQLRRQQAALEIQCWVRKLAAVQRVGDVRCHQRAMNQIALFCQARYRGFKGGEVACTRKREAAQQKLEHDASVRIQCAARARKAKKIVEIERTELRQLQYAGACTIQALVRERQYQLRYNEVLQERHRRYHLQQQEACTRIQSIHRRNVARQEADRRRAEKQRAAEELPPTKPKRVPLHMRRYSTYSVAQVASIAVAATGTGSGAIKSRRNSVMGLTRPHLSKQQRRSSCPNVTLAAVPVIDANNSEAKSSETKSVESASKSVSESSSPSSTVAPAGADFARQARKRAAARVQERKSKSSDDDDRENKVAKTMRNRVAAFENKRKQRLAAAKQKKLRRRCQIEQDSGGGESITATGAENSDKNCCNDIVVGEERSPPQACHCGETSATPPPTSNRSATIPPGTASEASSEPNLADDDTRTCNEPHNTTKEKSPIRAKKESPIHELAGFDAPFEDNFIETLDDLGSPPL